MFFLKKKVIALLFVSGIVLGQDKNLAGISVGFYNQNCPAEYKQQFLFSSLNTEFSVVNNLANAKYP